MKLYRLVKTFVIFCFYLFFFCFSVSAERERECLDQFFKCSADCQTSCHICTEGSVSGVKICGADPECTGSCIEECGAIKRDCDSWGMLVPESEEKTQNKTAASDIAHVKLYIQKEAEKIKEMKQCSGSPLPSQNPCVAGKLDSIIDESIFPVESQKNVEPIILEQNEKREIVGFEDIFAPAYSIDLNRVSEILDLYEASLKASQADSTKPAHVPIMRTSYARGVDGSEFSLVLLGDARVISPWKTVDTQTEVSSSSAIVTGKGSAEIVSPDKTVVKISPHSGAVISVKSTAESMTTEPSPPVFSPSEADVFPEGSYLLKFGAMHVDKSKDSKDVEVRTPLTTTKSKHTKFAVLYNPQDLYAVTIVYEGEVEVTDILNGFAATISPAAKDKPRVIVIPLI